MIKTAFVFLVVAAAAACYAEEREAALKPADIVPLVEKLGETAGRLEALEKENERLREQVERLNEFTARLARVLRDVELHVKPAASLRPDRETWESVRRGMTDDEVLDMLGNPEEIHRPLRGNDVWYYYGMGSISFDRRGRVVEQRSFEQLPIERKVR